MDEYIETYFLHHIETLKEVKKNISPLICDCVEIIASALQKNNKILIMGNGGSAADAQHFAAELVGRFMMERKALPAISLATDTSILTAVGNDYGFDEIFKRQIQALARPGDIAIGISTSGKSHNVYHALTEAKLIGCKTIGLLGRGGGTIAPIVDLNLTVPSEFTPHVQEVHVTIIHLLCDLIEKKMFPKGNEKNSLKRS